MKSILTLLLISSAQLGITQDILVGPELGINLIQIEKQDVGNNYQPGAFAGLAAEYRFNDHVSLRTGVYFSQGRNQTTDFDTTELNLFGLIDPSTIEGVDLNTYSTTTNRITQNYIQIPIMAKYAYNNFSAFGGGYVGFQVSGKTKSTTVSRTPFMSTIDIASIDPSGFAASFLPAANESLFEERSDKTNLRSFDYGFKAGFGYQMESFNINASYQYGIPDFRTDRGEKELQRHQFFQLSLSYMIALTFNESKSRIR